MISVLLATLSSLLVEVSSSVGKFAMRKKWESPPVMSLLNTLWTAGYFALTSIIFPASFVIQDRTILLFPLLIVLNIAQTVATTIAIQRASRSTFSLLRSLTIPLLAGIDAFTAPAMPITKYVAMGIMFVSIVWLQRNHGIEKRGALITIFTAVNASVTIALMKYVLTQGTSIAAAQLIVLAPILIVLAIWTICRPGPKLARGHTKIIAAQTASYGLSSLIESYALVFAPASVVTTASRSACVLWSIVFGHSVFHERRLHEKVIASIGIVIGLVLLAL